MDKSNYLLDDFEQVAKKSDDTVYELLRLKETGKPKEQRRKPKIAEESQEEAKATSARAKKSKPKEPQIDDSNWGRPVAILNTRIPVELSELIDDLVYRSKKSGNPTTKQAITIEALKELVKKRL